VLPALNGGSLRSAGFLPPSARRRAAFRNQIFAHRQSPDDDGVESNLSDEARRDINSVLVVAGDRNSDEFALSVRVRRQLGIVDRIESDSPESAAPHHVRGQFTPKKKGTGLLKPVPFPKLAFTP
jgi:hypothetical protein